MPINVTTGFGGIPQDVVSAVTNTVFARIIPSATGQRAAIRSIHAAPLPGSNLALPGHWIFPYYVLWTKDRFDKVQTDIANGIAPLFNQGLYDAPTQAQLNQRGYKMLWYRRPIWDGNEFSWEFSPLELICQNEETLIMCYPLASSFDQTTTTYAQETVGHTENVSILGETTQIDGKDAFPFKGRSVPAYDLDR